jgi:hypothetical protein
MQDVRSSKPSSVKLGNFHILASSLAAVAGVAIAGYQAFGPGTAPAPVNVVVSLDPQKADATVPDEIVAKTDAAPALPTEVVNLAADATYAAALKDGSDGRYTFAKLFDGQDDTFLAIAKPDQELNILVTFKDGARRSVTAIEYTPPPGVDPARMAKVADVMVLPDGQLEASGRPVESFSLPQSAEPRVFAIPGHAAGKGLWLRIAGDAAAEQSFVGDFRILSEGIAP